MRCPVPHPTSSTRTLPLDGRELLQDQVAVALLGDAQVREGQLEVGIPQPVVEVLDVA